MINCVLVNEKALINETNEEIALAIHSKSLYFLLTEHILFY